MKYKILIALEILFLFCGGCNRMPEPIENSDDSSMENVSISVGNFDEVPVGVVCSVNGEYISHSEIESVYDQFDGRYSYNKILGDSILEVLAIQLAPKYGLTVNDDEVQAAITMYKNQYPTFYDAAMEVNTSEEFINKIKTNLLFSKVKEYVCSHIISTKENVTQTELLSFKQRYGLIEHLKEYSDEVVISSLWHDIQNFLFLEWGEALKKEAEIIFYNPNDTTDVFRFNELSFNCLEENGRLYFDPETTYVDTWTFDDAIKYIGYDFRPSNIPEGLQCIVDCDKDYKFTVIYNSDGSMAYDVLRIDYEEYLETSESQESKLTVQVSKQEIWTDAPVATNEEEKMSIVGGVEVVLAGKKLPYGPYIETDDGDKIPSGYCDVLVAQFNKEGIYYRITTENIEMDEFIKILYSVTKD